MYNSEASCNKVLYITVIYILFFQASICCLCVIIAQNTMLSIFNKLFQPGKHYGMLCDLEINSWAVPWLKM